jgi:hypothetical protein
MLRVVDLCMRRKRHLALHSRRCWLGRKWLTSVPVRKDEFPELSLWNRKKLSRAVRNATVSRLGRDVRRCEHVIRLGFRTVWSNLCFRRLTPTRTLNYRFRRPERKADSAGSRGAHEKIWRSKEPFSVMAATSTSHSLVTIKVSGSDGGHHRTLPGILRECVGKSLILTSGKISQLPRWSRSVLKICCTWVRS